MPRFPFQHKETLANYQQDMWKDQDQEFCCIDSLIVGNIKMTDSKKITNEFASYFSTVGNKYSKKLAKSNKAINDYICQINNSNASLYLTPCTTR